MLIYDRISIATGSRLAMKKTLMRRLKGLMEPIKKRLHEQSSENAQKVSMK